MQYQLKSEQISLAQVFSKMEQVVDVLGIEDYSVSQTTLDNVSPKEAGARKSSIARVVGASEASSRSPFQNLPAPSASSLRCL